MTFKCNQCGLCCHHIDLAVKNTGMDFPYKWDENGVCEKYDNGCSVYEDRPTLCRVDDMADLLKIDKEKFYKMNTDACNTLKELYIHNNNK